MKFFICPKLRAIISDSTCLSNRKRPELKGYTSIIDVCKTCKIYKEVEYFGPERIESSRKELEKMDFRIIDRKITHRDLI